MNSATIFLFKRTATPTRPDIPSGDLTYTFSLGFLAGELEGWEQAVPITGGAYRWVISALAISTEASVTIPISAWRAASLLSEDGNCRYTATVYKQVDLNPGSPPAALSSYNFASGLLTPPEGWTVIQPNVATVNTWAVDYTFIGLDTETATGVNYWGPPRIAAVAGIDGQNVHIVTIYQQIDGEIVRPTGGSYKFDGDIFVAPSGWSRTMPTVGVNPTYMSNYRFSSNNPSAVILGGLWSFPVAVAVANIGYLNRFKSTCFKYNVGTPGTPTGGNYDNPVATGWSDGIPNYEAGKDLWMTSNIFYADYSSGSPWTAPVKITAATESSKIQFSVDNISWHNVPDEYDIYMRTGTNDGSGWNYAGSVKIKGETGSTGAVGATGVQLYTWVAYADDLTGIPGFTTGSPSPTTKCIGIAINKTSSAESSDPSKYIWSWWIGDAGQPGEPGVSTFTWFAYANSADGSIGFTTGAWTNELYIGLAFNKFTAVESEDPADYSWARMGHDAITPDMLDGTMRADFFIRESTWLFTLATLNWDAGFIDWADKTYTLAAGNLTNANACYIIATCIDVGLTATLRKVAVGTGLPILDLNEIIVAVTSSTANAVGNYLCYVRQSNSVMFEGAMIRSLNATEVTITNLEVGTNVAMGANATISWSKVDNHPTSLSGLDSTASTKLSTISPYATDGKLLNSDVALWTMNSASVVTSITDGAAGANALRLATGGSSHDIKVTPINASKKYRMKFWARPSIDCNGYFYACLMSCLANGSLHADNGGWLDYGAASALSKAAHDGNFGAGNWGEYTAIWSKLSGNWSHAGTVGFAAGFGNWSGTVGYWDIQGLIVEEVTEVLAAALTADWGNVANRPTVHTQAEIEAYATTITEDTVTSAFVNALEVTAKEVSAEWVYAGEVSAAQVNASGFTAQTANIGSAQVTTLKIGGNAVTIPVAGTVTGPVRVPGNNVVTEVLSKSVSFSVTPQSLLINCTLNAAVFSGAGYTMIATLTNVTSGIEIARSKASYVNNINYGFIGLSGVDTYTGLTRVYSVRVSVNDAILDVSDITLAAIGALR